MTVISGVMNKEFLHTVQNTLLSMKEDRRIIGETILMNFFKTNIKRKKRISKEKSNFEHLSVLCITLVK